MKVIPVLLLTGVLAACATPKSGEYAVAAGDRPSDKQVNEVVMGHLQSSLKDPDSLKQFRIVSGPSQISWYRGLIHGGGHEAAWLVCFEYNAKNSYGGYVGVKTDGIAMRASGEYAYQVSNVNWGMSTARCQ